MKPTDTPEGPGGEEGGGLGLLAATHEGTLCKSGKKIFLDLRFLKANVEGKTILTNKQPLFSKIKPVCVHNIKKVFFKKIQGTDYGADDNADVFDDCDTCTEESGGKVSTPLGKQAMRGQEWINVKNANIFTKGEEIVIGTGSSKMTRTVERVELNNSSESLGVLYLNQPLTNSVGGGVLEYTSNSEGTFTTKDVSKGQSFMFVHSSKSFSGSVKSLGIGADGYKCKRNNFVATVGKEEFVADIKAPKLLWGHADTKTERLGTAIVDRTTIPGYVAMEKLLLDAMSIEEGIIRNSVIDRLRNHRSGEIWTLDDKVFAQGWGEALATCLRRHTIPFDGGFVKMIKMTPENYFKNPLGSILIRRSLLYNITLKDEEGNNLRKLDVTKLKEINIFQVAISNELVHQIQIAMGAFIVNKGNQKIAKGSGLGEFKDTEARKKWLKETNEKMMKKVGVTMPAFDKDYFANLGTNPHVVVFMSRKENQKKFGFGAETSFTEIWKNVHNFAKKETKNPDANIFDVVRLGHMDPKTAWVLVEYLIYVNREKSLFNYIDTSRNKFSKIFSF